MHAVGAQCGTRAAAASGSGSGGRRGGTPGRGRPTGGRGRGRRFDCPPGQQPAADKQASFVGPFPQQPTTAIVGGGLAGLVCALELGKRGLPCVVFDTGEHGVGGRLATRTAEDKSLRDASAGVPGLIWDHAAQCFTASDPTFQAMVGQWEQDGVVQRWEGPVGHLECGTFMPDHSSLPRYIAPKGMRSLALYLAAQAVASNGEAGSAGKLVEVRRPQWVSEARHTPDGWRLGGKGRDQGVFDCVVVAHNGKCANRLTAPMGVPAVHSQLRRLKLSANWVLLAAFPKPLAQPFEGAFVRGCEVLSWAANNTAKLGVEGSPVECWTLISTQAYGRGNKVPQENVPPKVAQRVTAEMLAAFERSLGLPAGTLSPPVYTRAQLWGAALPQNSPRVPCIWDPVGRAGVCGDWVLEGGSMQAAALSGLGMAQRIEATCGCQPTDLADLQMGLSTPFKPAAGEEIGQFPGAEPTVAQQQQQQKAQQQQQQQQQAGRAQGAAPRQQPQRQQQRPEQQRRQPERQGAEGGVPPRKQPASSGSELLAKPPRIAQP